MCAYDLTDEDSDAFNEKKNAVPWLMYICDMATIEHRFGGSRRQFFISEFSQALQGVKTREDLTSPGNFITTMPIMHRMLSVIRPHEKTLSVQCYCSALHLANLAKFIGPAPPPTFPHPSPTFPHFPPPLVQTSIPPPDLSGTPILCPAYIKPTSCLADGLLQESADIGDLTPGLSAGPELRQAEALSAIDPLTGTYGAVMTRREGAQWLHMMPREGSTGQRPRQNEARPKLMKI